MTVVVGRGGKRLPVSGAKAWPLAGLNPYASSGLGISMPRGIDLMGGEAISYEDLYRSQPWVTVCVNKLSRGVGRLPVKVYKEAADDSRERTKKHPLADLVERPYPRGTRFSLIEAMVGNVAIHGNALAVKYRPRSGAPPTELWPIPWRYITPIAGEDEPWIAYRYDGPIGSRFFLPEDVVHLQWWAPDGRAGVSPLEPLAETLSAEQASQRYARSSFENDARPSSVVTHPQKLKPDQRDKLRSEIQQLYGGLDPEFRVALLDGGLEWKAISQTAQETEAIAFRKLGREEVAAVYDIPPPLVGILDHATFSNVTEQHRMLYQDTLGPWLTMLELGLMAQLVSPEPAWTDVLLEFDLAGVLRGNPKERSEAYQRDFQSGVATINELRRLENRPPIDSPIADSPMAPVNMVPVDPKALELWRELMGSASSSPAPSSDAGPASSSSEDVAALEERIARLEAEAAKRG